MSPLSNIAEESPSLSVNVPAAEILPEVTILVPPAVKYVVPFILKAPEPYPVNVTP